MHDTLETDRNVGRALRACTAFVVPRRRLPSWLFLVLAAATPVMTGQEDEPPLVPGGDIAERQRQRVLRCYIEDPLKIDGARELEAYIDASHERHRNPDIKTIFFFIDSVGASPDPGIEAAKDYAALIANLKGVTTVGYIRGEHRAGNAAVLIALACHKLVLEQGATLGFVSDSETEIPDRDDEDAREARNEITLLVTRRKRPYPAALAEALVSKFHRDVYEVGFQVFDPQTNNQTVQNELLTDEDLANLPPRKKLQMVPEENRKPVSADRGPRLKLTAAEALRYGFATAIVADYEDALAKLELLVGPEDTIDQRRGPLKPASREGQAVVDFLNHIVIRFVLLLGGFLCLMIEFKMPGTFVPLAISVGCFLIFFLAGLFPPTGAVQPTTNIYELALFVVGVGLVMTELFLLPGIMFFGFLGTVFVMISIVLALLAPEGAVAEQLSAKDAFSLLVISLAVSFGLFFLLLRVLPRVGLLNRSGMVTHASIKGIPTADDIFESQEKSSALLGRIGTALTPLHPSGRIDLAGEVLDVVSEGEFIERGERVEVIEASGFRAVVRRARPDKA
jgi:membrane-bound serine protease (ClpP class)